MLTLSIIIALCLDAFLGEPRRWHPLVGFGRFAAGIESRIRGWAPDQAQGSTLNLLGTVAWVIAVVPLVNLCDLLLEVLPAWPSYILGILVLYFCIGSKSLAEHARNIARPLLGGNLEHARKQLSLIVSRDTSGLSARGVSRGAIESVLENGSDAVLAPIFWFAIFGPVGALAYRLSNTLDAMWGYKNERYLEFGRCAAKVDDVLNYVPARLCALSYALVGKTKTAIRSWRRQAHRCESPNAGPVMAAGAGALGVCIGGSANYHGDRQFRPILGEGPRAQPNDIQRALHLLWWTCALWVLVIAVLELAL